MWVTYPHLAEMSLQLQKGGSGVQGGLGDLWGRKSQYLHLAGAVGDGPVDAAQGWCLPWRNAPVWSGLVVARDDRGDKAASCAPAKSRSGTSSLGPDLSPAEAVCSGTGMLAALQIEMSLVLSPTC